MATTDTRSGFRLPWSSDRSHDDNQHEESVEPAATTVGVDTSEASALTDGSEVTAGEPWPEIDVSSRLGGFAQRQGPIAQADTPTSSAEEPETMVDTANAPAPTATPAPRKPSKLIADLAAAMRATAEVAREQALAQVEADAGQVVEAIRARSTEGTAELRRRADEDIAGVREWSKAEIARIREETDRRISDRKSTLETELTAHASGIERRVEDVQKTVAAYETEMAEFFDRLLGENDPGRLATMAESMPEPPALTDWIERDDLDASAASTEAETTTTTEAEATTTTVETTTATATAADAEAPAPDTGEDQPAGEAEAGEAEAGEVEPTADSSADAADAWSDTDSAWGNELTTAEAAEDHANGTGGWTASSAPGAEPADRDAIMAALEAAAEAVGAAEAAAASADQAEVAADVAETAAGLLVGRMEEDDEGAFDPANDPEAEAAIAARLDAFGGPHQPTLADRLASFLPGAGAAAVDGEPVTTQVIVTGLVSVASIASFKRHLGRIAGVRSVSVSSGPDGEFVFIATHRSDVPFRDLIPSLPSFAARVTGSGEGIVQVTAHDPETEG